MHVPVLLHEVISCLDPKPGSFIIDATVDGGGHAGSILEKIGPKGKFLGIDWDPDILSLAKQKFADTKNIKLVAGNYADLPRILAREKLPKADGLLVDLGFSSEQLANSKKGFSFSADEPLLMTYDPSMTPVWQLLRALGEDELVDILRTYSDERYARPIAQAIKSAERKQPIATSKALAEIIADALPKNYERGRIHPATRTFQALRIYANDELGNLNRLLAELPEIISSGGRVAIISFHSLEDRIVKNAFRDLAKRGMMTLFTKKPLTARREEIILNPRSRSAKLRAGTIT